MSRPITYRRDGDSLVPFAVERPETLTLDDEEVWVIIAQFPAYAVSSHGKVWRCVPFVEITTRTVRKHPRQIAQRSMNAWGHLGVTMSMGKHRLDAVVSRLVAAAFLPEPNIGKDCALHRDDVPAHNWPANLFWGSRTDNSNDKVSKGRQAKGERVSSAKITVEDVRDIRARAAAGHNQYDIASDMGITQSNVSMIVNRVTWAHVI